MTAAARKPHPHAEALHAFADGLDIQSFDSACGWYDDSHPGFFADRQYRVKPEKVYPVSQMGDGELCSVFYNGGIVSGPSAELVAFSRIANASLRHAIDAQQVIPMPEVQEVARNLNAEQHKKELQAVAAAVYHACADTVSAYSGAHAHRLREAIDLDKIIAGVKP